AWWVRPPVGETKAQAGSGCPGSSQPTLTGEGVAGCTWNAEPLCFRDRALLQGAPDAVELRELSPWVARPSGPRRRAGPRRRRARPGSRPCGLRELEVRVSELGLGYTSDETVLFRYCAGACEAAIRIYDLGLRRLRQRRRVRKERVRAHPCCRPTAYEDEVSFLDVHSRYHTLQELSARECACV
uniref:Neurturin n=1 Tax=Rattus norvegicus TaxID=10116 RepID=Q811Q5_RAT